MYVVGGSDDTSRLHSVERYDISRDQWSPVPPMSTARNGVGVTAVGGKYLYLNIVLMLPTVTNNGLLSILYSNKLILQYLKTRCTLQILYLNHYL